jgi:hypothetical protein
MILPEGVAPPTVETHPPRKERACRFKFKKWNGLWYGWCDKIGCPNRIRPRPYKVKRVSARCQGIYEPGDIIAFMIRVCGWKKKCGSCEHRQEWINRAWRWLVSRLTSA